MTIDHFSAFAALAAIGGPGIFVSGIRDFRLKQLIENTPTSRIRSMAMGLAEVNGVIEARSLVTAPFSGRSCAAWNVDVSVQGRKNAWTVVHRATSGHPFFLRDETGVALVYPQGAAVHLNFAVEETCGGLLLPEPYAGYLATLGPRRFLWRFGLLRFRERILEAGARVYVMGSATPPPHSVTVSMGEEARRVRSVDTEVAAVIRRGENNRTFVISQAPERSLTLGLGIKAFLKLVGGPLATLFGLGYWLLAFQSRAILR